jgi:dihydroneopterin aldolase
VEYDMDKTATAFDMPHARAAETRAAQLPDRISVRDYTRTVEIGAFSSERGVTQRIRFNVVLEVCHHAAAQDDDVDKVISYDSITDAIEAALAFERINLLETLAERVAGLCLADRRAVRVFVRVEKLDRIPGALGVEIVRSRPPEDAPRIGPVDEVLAAGSVIRPRVVYLDASVMADGWLDALAASGQPVLLCVSTQSPQPVCEGEAQRRIGLLAIEQNAWRLVDGDPRFEVVSSRTEIDWAVKAGRLPVWAPSKMVMDSLDPSVPGASRPADLAAWLAAGIDAECLILIGDTAVSLPMDLPVHLLEHPGDLDDLA